MGSIPASGLNAPEGARRGGGPGRHVAACWSPVSCLRAGCGLGP